MPAVRWELTCVVESLRVELSWGCILDGAGVAGAVGVVAGLAKAGGGAGVPGVLGPGAVLGAAGVSRRPSLTLVTGSWNATALVGAGEVDCEQAGDVACGGVTECTVMMVGQGSTSGNRVSEKQSSHVSFP